MSTGEPDRHLVAPAANPSTPAPPNGTVEAQPQPPSTPAKELAGPTSRPQSESPSIVVVKPNNPKLSRQVKRMAAPASAEPSPVRGRSNTEDEDKAAIDLVRRRATVGEGKAPLAPGFWGHSPLKNPNPKIISLESGKSINQIFDNLKAVFEDLDAEVKVKKKRGSVRVTATHKDAEGKKSKIKVSVQESKETGGSVVTFKNALGKKDDEQFAMLVEHVEQRVDPEMVLVEEHKDEKHEHKKEEKEKKEEHKHS